MMVCFFVNEIISIICIISLITLISIILFTKDVSSFSAVISDEEDGTSNQHNPVDNEDMHGTRTPPTPPSRSPPLTSPRY